MTQKPIDNPFDFTPTENKKIDSTRTFNDELIGMKGELISVYIGDQSETTDWVDHSIPYNCCIYGKLVDVLDRVIIVDCMYVDKTNGKVSSGNLVWLNTFQIRVLTKLDGAGSLEDIFLNASDANKIRKHLLAIHKNK